MRIHSRQRGMSAIQILVLIVLGLFLVFTGIRIGGLYFEYFNVHSSLNSVRDEAVSGDSSISSRSLREGLERRLRINNVQNVERSDISVTLEGYEYVLRVEYEARAQWIGNLDVVARFEREVRVPRQ